MPNLAPDILDVAHESLKRFRSHEPNLLERVSFDRCLTYARHARECLEQARDELHSVAGERERTHREGVIALLMLDVIGAERKIDAALRRMAEILRYPRRAS